MVVACATATTACSGPGEEEEEGESSEAAISLPLTPTCGGKSECTISPSRRASFYRHGAGYQVDISGATTGQSDNSYSVAVGENFGILGDTTRWILDEGSRRGLRASQVSVRGTSLGAVDALSVIIHGGASRGVVFGVPSDPLFWFSVQLSAFHAAEDVSVTVIQGERDPIVAGTRRTTRQLDSRIALRWVSSPYPSGADVRNHYREAYCPVAPQTCFY